MSETVKVPELAKQTESRPIEWDWVDRRIWTDNMLAALGNCNLLRLHCTNQPNFVNFP